MALDDNNSALKNFVRCTDSVDEDKLKEVAKQSLGETEELKMESLKQLKALVREHGVVCITRDDFLLRFLRFKKFDVRRSFRALRNYSNQMATHREVFLKMKPETVRVVLREKIFTILPYRDANERTIFYTGLGAWNPNLCSDEDWILTLLLLVNYASEKQASQIFGMVTIHDLKNVSLFHIPYLLRHRSVVCNFLFESLPIRYPKVHVINEPSFMKYIVWVLYPFIPKKIWGRMLFHGKSEGVLLQHMEAAILPSDFGGNLGLLNSDHLMEEMTRYLQKFVAEQRCFIKQDCGDSTS